MKTEKTRWLLSQLEDRAGFGGWFMWTRALYSIAISLKRIADAQSRSVELQLPETLPDGLHHSITHTAWEAGRNFQHGTRTDR